MKNHPYSVLGISEGSSDETILTAYRTLAKENHPDKNINDDNAHSKFQEINEAYECIKNKERRIENGFGQEEFFSGNNQDYRGSSRWGIPPRSPVYGEDADCDLKISLEDVLTGKSVNFKYYIDVACKPCKGTGFISSTNTGECYPCKGTGQFKTNKGMFSVVDRCLNCDGAGWNNPTQCKACHGHGKRQAKTQQIIDIKRGVDNNEKISYLGKGSEGLFGGTRGNLNINITLKKHKIFKRNKNNLYQVVEIPVQVAILGGEILIPSLKGDGVLLTIKKNDKNVFIIYNKGLPDFRVKGKQGDMFIKTIISIPDKLTSTQQNLLIKFAKSLKED